MDHLNEHIQSYLDFCRTQKCLDEKTLKAYRIDLRQFLEQLPDAGVSEITPALIERYIAGLHRKYKPKTAKRKIASVKALFHYFEYRGLIERSPFSKIRTRFREPVILPKTIPLHTVEAFLAAIYRQRTDAATGYQRKNALRDAAVAEVLFATGIRISELCGLKDGNVNLCEGTVLIYGKGGKERRIQIASDAVLRVLREYRQGFAAEIDACGRFFANQSGRPLSDQAVRRMINKYAALASIGLHITPHMFRHTFATCLLDADVDIRIIQELLGHSSINITEIYTHVAVAKQRNILIARHPRKDFRI